MLDIGALVPLLRAALAEDIGPGDLTSELCVPEGVRARAVVRAKADGVLAGVPVALRVLRLAAEGHEFVEHSLAVDGSRVARGDVVLDVESDARSLLCGERTALNFLIRLSGIATMTAQLVAAVEGTGARILDTRKTTPCLRELEKYAVRKGGGHNHRFALYDAILVKENHLTFGSDLAAALAARPAGVEAIVEAESLEEFRRASAAGADVVMLDDFTPKDVVAARAERGASGRPLLEVSGGIRLDNVREYAAAGVDRISVGALTHSAPALDLSMRIQPL